MRDPSEYSAHAAEFPQWPLDATQTARVPAPSQDARAKTAGPAVSDPAGPAFCFVDGRNAPAGLASTGAGDAARASDEASASPQGLHLSDAVMAVLAVVAAHDGVSPQGWIARAVTRRADAIGLGPLVDRMQHVPENAVRHGINGADSSRRAAVHDTADRGEGG
jgi:hypothetical protein